MKTIFNNNQNEASNQTKTEENFSDQSIKILISKKENQASRTSMIQKSLLQNKQNQLITVPIKQYSNKFLRQKKKEDLQTDNKKKQPFLSSHLQHNRKLISQFKKFKGRSQKIKKSNDKENNDFIIYNLLFQRDNSSISIGTNNMCRKTIFGTFTQNSCWQSVHEQSSLFENGWKTTKHGSLFQSKKQVYEKICEKQRNLIPQYRKKCKTFADNSTYQNNEHAKMTEKISTSRALEKYSKIIKINPEHGKIQKMKIKKQLAKSLRFEGFQTNDIETKQITLAKKQFLGKNKSMSINGEKQDIIRHHSTHDCNTNNEIRHQLMKTPEKARVQNEKQRFITSKVGLFTSGVKFKKLRKFSHQVESNKKCITEQKRETQGNQTFDDFQINGWDINF